MPRVSPFESKRVPRFPIPKEVRDEEREAHRDDGSLLDRVRDRAGSRGLGQQVPEGPPVTSSGVERRGSSPGETFVLNVRDPEAVIAQLGQWLASGAVTSLYKVPQRERGFVRPDKKGRP